jgi:hypothetical protein
VRNRWIATAVGGALVVAAITAVGVLVDHDPERPADWDPRVADLTEFVQNERGLLFDHPVPIDFLTEQQYSDRFADRDHLTDDDVAQLEQVEGEMRALGLINGDVDLVASMSTLALRSSAARRLPVERPRVRFPGAGRGRCDPHREPLHRLARRCGPRGLRRDDRGADGPGRQ